MLEDVVEDEGVEGAVCDTISQSSCALEDLAGDLDEGVEELFEFHLDDLLLKLWVIDEQSIPDFEGPGQGCDDHVDPVGVKGIGGSVEGRHAILELFDLVFLVAPGIGEEDELVFLSGLIVGDIEKEKCVTIRGSNFKRLFGKPACLCRILLDSVVPVRSQYSMRRSHSSHHF